MSLMRHAIRVATVLALRGRTLVGDNVLDSQNGAIDFDGDNNPRTEMRKPFVAIYTYDGKSEPHNGGRDLSAGGSLMIGIEIGHAAGMLVPDPATGKKELVEGLSYTDRSVEFYLELLAAEITAALGDPDNIWGEIWRALVVSVESKSVMATRSVGGQRLAGHQIMLTVSTLRDPGPGSAIDDDHVYERFLNRLALVEGEDVVQYRSQANLLRSFLGNPETRDWHLLQRRRGLTADELLALGHGPMRHDIERATPEFESATFGTAVVVAETDGGEA